MSEPALPETPPSIEELQALLPWAAMETNDDGELVIYTGIRLDDDSTHWIKGMGDE